METALAQTDLSERIEQTEFTTEEAAVFVGSSAGYLQNLRQIGDGPPYQRRWKRKGIYYLRPDLEEWKRGRRYLSTSEY